MWISLEVTHSIVCPTCNMRNALPGLRQHLKCSHCRADISVKEAFKGQSGGMRHLFGGDHDALAEAVVLLDEGHAGTGIELATDYRCEFFRWKPRCPECEKPFSEAQYTNPAPTVTCHDCGHTLPVRIPDEKSAKWDPRLHLIINDAGENGDPRRRETPAAAKPVVLSCAACGANLSIDGKSREVKCEHCGSDNYLPDELWQQLHPGEKGHVFYLIYRVDPLLDFQLHAYFFGPNKARYAAKKKRLEVSLHRALEDFLKPESLSTFEQVMAEKLDPTLRNMILGDTRLTPAHLEIINRQNPEADLELAGKKNLSAELIEKLALAADSRVRRQIASHEQLPAPLAIRLASDAEETVRAKIAGRQALLPELFSTLAEDPEASVRAVIAARADAAPEALAKLAHDSAASVRAAVAANHSTPAPALGKLARDKDDKVAAFARENANYQPGFLARLFGK